MSPISPTSYNRTSIHKVPTMPDKTDRRVPHQYRYQHGILGQDYQQNNHTRHYWYNIESTMAEYGLSDLQF